MAKRGLGSLMSSPRTLVRALSDAGIVFLPTGLRRKGQESLPDGVAVTMPLKSGHGLTTTGGGAFGTTRRPMVRSTVPEVPAVAVDAMLTNVFAILQTPERGTSGTLVRLRTARKAYMRVLQNLSIAIKANAH